MLLSQWYTELVSRFGVDQDDWVVVCDNCGALQCYGILRQNTINPEIFFGRVCMHCHAPAFEVQTEDGPRMMWAEACETCAGDTVVCMHGNRLADCTEVDCDWEPHQCPECRQ